jgi:hypothetical protein
VSPVNLVLQILSVAVVATISGWACALLAQRRRVPARRWLGFGMAAGLVASALPSPLSYAIVGLAALAVFSDPDAPVDTGPVERDSYRLWWVKVGCLVFAGLIAYAPLAGGLASLKRNATASATVISTTPINVTSNPYRGTGSSGLSIEYQFVAEGRQVQGLARRTWESDELHDLKVCYDPADPDHSHMLVLPGYDCGRLDPFRPSDG